MDCVNPAQDKEQWRFVVNVVKKGELFFTSSVTVSFSTKSIGLGVITMTYRFLK
jgi:hypothetical protein